MQVLEAVIKPFRPVHSKNSLNWEQDRPLEPSIDHLAS